MDDTSLEPNQPKSSGSAVNIILWIISILVIIGVAYAVYYFVSKLNKNSNTQNQATTTPSSSTNTATQSSTGGAVEQYYTKTVAMQATGEKAKAVDTVMLPILQKIYNNDVKLGDETGPMLTYVVKRQITASDVTATKTALEAAGFKATDSSAKQLTMTKVGSTWVITFAVDKTDKATIEITF
jgi:heme/copper-type cytochrome/quinol oxidase subunit 2